MVTFWGLSKLTKVYQSVISAVRSKAVIGASRWFAARGTGAGRAASTVAASAVPQANLDRDLVRRIRFLSVGLEGAEGPSPGTTEPSARTDSGRLVATPGQGLGGGIRRQDGRGPDAVV